MTSGPLPEGECVVTCRSGSRVHYDGRHHGDREGAESESGSLGDVGGGGGGGGRCVLPSIQRPWSQ